MILAYDFKFRDRKGQYTLILRGNLVESVGLELGCEDRVQVRKGTELTFVTPNKL